MSRSIWRWILRNTVMSRNHLTPEFGLRLITEDCPLWMSTPEQCPYEDPYWAFYWPGGQCMSRFLLDQPEAVRNKVVLDFGCGCGASTIAASEANPKQLIANDIDTALAATVLNCKLNRVSKSLVKLESRNLLKLHLEDFKKSVGPEVIIFGDVFYDGDFARDIAHWLSEIYHYGMTPTVFIGDPGRHGIQHLNSKSLSVIAEYSLPAYISQQHHGFSTAKIYKFEL